MKVSPAIRAALRGNEPSSEQLLAITHPAEPLAIIAGAGSGKTAIMAARMVWMVEEAIAAPPQILGLTFTNKAAGELEERILMAFAEMDPIPQEIPTVATYNAFADRLVREHGVRIGIDSEVGILSQGQSWQLAFKALEQVGAFEAIDSRSIASICGKALNLSDQCDNHFVSPEQLIQEDTRTLEEGGSFDEKALAACRSRIELSRLVSAYRREKMRARRIDYGDQVAKAVQILEGFPAVLQDLRARYPAILLDEYQDTNVAQRRMLQALAPQGANVTAVGDARQNIFQWRGSTLFNLIDFPTRDFLRAGGATHQYLSLSKNFRSGSRILEAANAIIAPVPQQRRPGKPLAADPRNHDGFVGVKVVCDQYSEAGFIVDEISRLHNNQAHPGRRSIDWKDIAILVRRKSHMGPIYSALRRNDIPVEVIGLSGLLEIPEVVDTISWLRVLADPGPASNRWLARILLGPRFRIHYRDLAVLARWAAKQTVELRDSKRGAAPPDGQTVVDETAFEPDEVAFSLTEALEHVELIEDLPAAAIQRLSTMRSELARLRKKSAGVLLELVQAVVEDSGIAENLQSSPRKDAAASLTNLTQFVAMVAGFAPVSGEPTLNAFLDYLDAAEDADDSMELEVATSDDSVKLTTVHRAKGLEFEVVFVPGVAARENKDGVKVDSIFPDERTGNPTTSYDQLPYRVREDAEHLPLPWKLDPAGKRIWKKKSDFTKELKVRAIEDERRLFYVALTRAKQRLYVTAAWWYERQGDLRGPSIFLDEVKNVAGVEDLGVDEVPEQSPLRAQLEAQAIWPPEPASWTPRHAEFPEGYPVVLERILAGDLSEEDLLARLQEEERSEAVRLLDEFRHQMSVLRRAEENRDENRPAALLPKSLSATHAVALNAGELSADDIARPLPERPIGARRIGTEIHRWIEEQAHGLTGLADEEALDEPSIQIEPSKVQHLKSQFDKLGFAGRKLADLDTGEPMSEVPFVLKLGERLIRGRIDAVYETPEGGIEIVDFKTGAETAVPPIDQLVVYAAALVKLGFYPERPLKLTYCYLASGTVSSRSLSADSALSALEELGLALRR